jgi:hypothetical protein
MKEAVELSRKIGHEKHRTTISKWRTDGLIQSNESGFISKKSLIARLENGSSSFVMAGAKNKDKAEIQANSDKNNRKTKRGNGRYRTS